MRGFTCRDTKGGCCELRAGRGAGGVGVGGVLARGVAQLLRVVGRLRCRALRLRAGADARPVAVVLALAAASDLHRLGAVRAVVLLIVLDLGDAGTEPGVRPLRLLGLGGGLDAGGLEEADELVVTALALHLHRLHLLVDLRGHLGIRLERGVGRFRRLGIGLDAGRRLGGRVGRARGRRREEVDLRLGALVLLGLVGGEGRDDLEQVVVVPGTLAAALDRQRLLHHLVVLVIAHVESRLLVLKREDGAVLGLRAGHSQLSLDLVGLLEWGLDHELVALVEACAQRRRSSALAAVRCLTMLCTHGDTHWRLPACVLNIRTT